MVQWNGNCPEFGSPRLSLESLDAIIVLCVSVPRSRNSIAVSSVEHLKNGAKRPHSIISVSSCSSSSSSGHSSGFGAMTIPGLETMPEDVAFMPGARTSLTLCSNGTWSRTWWWWMKMRRSSRKNLSDSLPADSACKHRKSCALQLSGKSHSVL